MKGDRYWIIMGDSPPICVESGTIGADGERIPDPQPSWRGNPVEWPFVVALWVAGLVIVALLVLLAVMG